MVRLQTHAMLPVPRANPFFNRSGHPMERFTLYPTERAGGISTQNDGRRSFLFWRSTPKSAFRNGYSDTRVMHFFRTAGELVSMTRTGWNIWRLAVLTPTSETF